MSYVWNNIIKNAGISLVGRNVLFFYKKAPFDPELTLGTGNGSQGFESFQIPSATSIGVTIRAEFKDKLNKIKWNIV